MKIPVKNVAVLDSDQLGFSALAVLDQGQLKYFEYDLKNKKVTVEEYIELDK